MQQSTSTPSAIAAAQPRLPSPLALADLAKVSGAGPAGGWSASGGPAGGWL